MNDVIETTRANVAGVGSADQVRAAGLPLAAFSEGMAAQERRLKAFMYANLYHHLQQRATAGRAREVIARLYAAYSQDPARLPERWRAALPAAEPERSRHIADFIAGMTDRYAMNSYTDIFGDTPRGLSNV